VRDHTAPRLLEEIKRAEDEARAAADSTVRWVRVHPTVDEAGARFNDIQALTQDATGAEEPIVLSNVPMAVACHLVRSQPAHVLKRCEADRKIVNTYLDAYSDAWMSHSRDSQVMAADDGRVRGLEYAVQCLAEAYGVRL
jgi:hypothetical protein